MNYLRNSILITIFTLLSLSYSKGFLSIDTVVQRLSQISTSQSIESSGIQQSGKDIFLTTLWNFSSADSSAMLQSISSITKGLQTSNPSACTELKNNHIVTILLRSPAFIQDLYNYSNIALNQEIPQDWDIKQACEHVLHCIWTLETNQTITDTTREIRRCETIVLNAYVSHKTLESNFSSLPLANNNDNIYMDNVKDNGLFDIMIDIKNIESLLFDPWNKWPELPQMIYYSLPKTIQPSNSNNSNSNIPWTIGWGNSFYSTVNNSWTNTQGNTAETATNNPPIISWSSLGSVIDTFVSSNTSANISSQALGNSSTIISQAVCLVDSNNNDYLSWIWGNNNWWSWTGLWNTTTIIDEFTNLQNDLINAMSWYIYTPWYNWNNPYIWGNFIQTTWAVPSTTPTCAASCSTTEWTEKLICEGKCCMNSCNQISNLSDRAICLSQCLCWEASVANDMLRIKICRVPAQPSRVIAWKKITSIEQAIDEINQIFLKLKQNGALTKRTKTQEFLDSSFSSIKFHKILAFDIFVAIKPIYDRLQSREVEKQAKDNATTLAILNNTNWKLSQWADKNKYSISGIYWSNDEEIIKNCELIQWGKYNAINKKCEWWVSNTTALLLLANTNANNSRNDALWLFLSEQYTFWEEIYNQFSEIQVTVKNLREKAEQAQ